MWQFCCFWWQILCVVAIYSFLVAILLFLVELCCLCDIFVDFGGYFVVLVAIFFVWQFC